jgi:hypothetical protein
MVEWYRTHQGPVLDILGCPAFSNPDMVVTNRLLSDGQQHGQEQLVAAMHEDRSVLTIALLLLLDCPPCLCVLTDSVVVMQVWH